MAGDWIKMRTDLYRDPKVILMADLLMDGESELSRSISQQTQRDRNVTRNVMRNATVGALVTVWGIIRTQAKRAGDDATLDGVTPAVVDDIADVPGFGDAMEQAGWLITDGKRLVFPRFFAEHNSEYDSAKAKARERQRRYRERKKRNVTVTLRNAPREEKRREEVSVTTNVVTQGRTKFTKPTLEDVTAYCRTRNNHVDPQQFIDHYESNGWKVGKNPMKDWKAAVRTWEKNDLRKDSHGTNRQGGQPSGRVF